MQVKNHSKTRLLSFRDISQLTNRNIQGEPRMLLFSPSSRILYFTTTLSHSIQAYSIATSALLPPLPEHPSPPNVLAISKCGHFLLSTSQTPPTIILQDVRQPGSAPIRFFPSHDMSSVTCGAFHDKTESSIMTTCLFVLGFQDGTLALYRLAMAPLSGAPIIPDDVHQPHGSALKEPVRIKSMKRLHKAAMGGVCAAEFLPGYHSRVVSIGHDGKCRMVDFENGSELLRTWRVDGRATSLSVVAAGPIYTRGRKERDVIIAFDGIDEDKQEEVYEGTEVLIAIGTEPGKALIFNVLGLLVNEISIPDPVVSLEWVGDMGGPPLLPDDRRAPSSPFTPIPRSPSQPVLDMLRIADEIASGEESGTVKRTASPQSPSAAISPIQFGPVRDLFSASPERCITPGFPKRLLSLSPPGSPHDPLHRASKRARKLYSRPRIVTETFKVPNSQPISDLDLSGSPTASTPSAMMTTLEVRQYPHLHVSTDTPVMSGALGLRGNDSCSVYSIAEKGGPGTEPDGSEAWVTPPTSSHHTPSSYRRRRSRSVAFSSPGPGGEVRFAGDSPPMSLSVPRSPASRRVHCLRHWLSRTSLKSGYGSKIWDHEVQGMPMYHQSPMTSQPPNLPSTAGERIHRMRQYLRNDSNEDKNKGDAAGAAKLHRERDSLRLANEILRQEIEALRQEFVLFRTAMLGERSVMG